MHRRGATATDSMEDRIRLIIFYAENDAYPEWAFEI